MLLVYPEGVRKQWNDGRPEILKGNRIYDDVGFIYAVIDEVAQDYSIDRDSNDGTDVEIQSVGNCREGVGVTLVKVTNGGHTWPIHRSGIAVSGAMAIATPVYPETLPP